MNFRILSYGYEKYKQKYPENMRKREGFSVTAHSHTHTDYNFYNTENYLSGRTAYFSIEYYEKNPEHYCITIEDLELKTFCLRIGEEGVGYYLRDLRLNSENTDINFLKKELIQQVKQKGVEVIAEMCAYRNFFVEGQTYGITYEEYVENYRKFMQENIYDLHN